MRESQYQSHVVRKLKEEFPGCYVLKNDPEYQQGFPDLLVLFKGQWAALEIKAAYDSPKQPNQDYFIGLLDDMSYGRFLFPEVEEEVFIELRQLFKRRASVRTNF